MKVAVSNSNPLILLEKINSLNLLFNIFDEIFIPPPVFEEVVTRGIEENHPDAQLINDAINRNKIRVRKPDEMNSSTSSSNLHLREIQAINLAIFLQKNMQFCWMRKRQEYLFKI